MKGKSNLLVEMLNLIIRHSDTVEIQINQGSAIISFIFTMKIIEFESAKYALETHLALMTDLFALY